MALLIGVKKWSVINTIFYNSAKKCVWAHLNKNLIEIHRSKDLAIVGNIEATSPIGNSRLLHS